MVSTEIVNHTSKAMKVKVGFNGVHREIGTVVKDGVYEISVDPNGTYQEFCLGVDATGKPIIVNSDECIDNMHITVSEVQGKFDVVKVERQVKNKEAAAPVDPRAHAAGPHNSVSLPKATPHRRQSSGWTFWKS